MAGIHWVVRDVRNSKSSNGSKDMQVKGSLGILIGWLNSNTTEHHEYVTENHDRDDFTTEHKYHRTPWICYRKTSEKKLQKKTDQPASDITILATHQSIVNSGEPWPQTSLHCMMYRNY